MAYQITRSQPWMSAAQPNRQDPDAASGDWKDGRFLFKSPAALEAWYRASYRQAVNADSWHLGDKVDDRTRDVILAGVSGATPPMYRGPDGQHYFQNERTIEDAATRAHRLKHSAGKTLNQITAPKLPGEDAYIEIRRIGDGLKQPANDNLKFYALNCSEERAACKSLCAVAMGDPSMGGIWGGGWGRCMLGCLPAKCGGNPVG